jgi:nucleoside-diphosphate-sugar epimerase
MYIEDCIKGTEMIFNSNQVAEVFNLGSSEQVSINQMINQIEEISGYKIDRKYMLNKPKGVRGRNSDNEKIIKVYNWEPSTLLKDGLEKTYKWIYDQIIKKDNTNKFARF